MKVTVKENEKYPCIMICPKSQEIILFISKGNGYFLGKNNYFSGLYNSGTISMCDLIPFEGKITLSN
jgi:hypothetical protein